MRKQPKAVLFDYGNVLSLPQPRSDVEAMAAVFDVSVARFEEAYWRDRADFDRAVMSPHAYWTEVAAALSRNLTSPEREHVIDLDNRSWSHPNPVMVSWAQQVRAAGLRTGVLSNMPITLREHLHRYSTWLPQFDHSCYSCDVRQAKPAREIYLLCIEGLGLDAGEILFLDDRPENIETARSLGIHAIQFDSPEQAQCEIHRQYDLPVPIPCQSASAGRASQSPSSS